MTGFHIRLKEAMNKRNITQSELCEQTGIPKSAMSQYISGSFKPKQDRTDLIADALKVNGAWLMGYDVPMERDKTSGGGNIISHENIRMIPVYESLCAGFGKHTENLILEYIPLYIENDTDAENTLCVVAKGNSMYPKIERGDKIQILRQENAENGQIVAAQIDGKNDVVKKIDYAENTIILSSFNPEYEPKVFCGDDRNRIKILGVVKAVIKEF